MPSLASLTEMLVTLMHGGNVAGDTQFITYKILPNASASISGWVIGQSLSSLLAIDSDLTS